MKYYVNGVVTISVGCVVEADSAAQAKELAEETGLMNFCHQCSGGANEERMDEWRTSGELDGTVVVLGAEECE
jgi:hypothetical protein